MCSLPAKTAFIFPGQGSQYVGMGRWAYDAREDVRALYGIARERTGYDIAGLSFEGPEQELNADVAAQLAVYTCNEAYRLVALRDGLLSDAVTGYSLGFYSALVAAGVIDFGEGLSLVQRAGELALSCEVPGTMAAVIGLGLDELEGLCVKSGGQVWVSNVNAARQALVSGAASDVERLVGLAMDAGALSAYRLGMGAAYHSPLMVGASARFLDGLRDARFDRPMVPLMSYIDGRYLDDPDAIRRTVGSQLSSRALWKETVMALVGDGFGRFVEMGPGGALTRMVRWVDRGVEAVPFEALMEGAAHGGA